MHIIHVIKRRQTRGKLGHISIHKWQSSTPLPRGLGPPYHLWYIAGISSHLSALPVPYRRCGPGPPEYPLSSPERKQTYSWDEIRTFVFLKIPRNIFLPFLKILRKYCASLSCYCKIFFCEIMFAPRYAEFPSDNFCYKGRRAERVQLPFSFQPSRSHGGHGSGQDGAGEPGGGHRQLQQEGTEEEEEEEDKQLWTNSFPGKKRI